MTRTLGLGWLFVIVCGMLMSGCGSVNTADNGTGGSSDNGGGNSDVPVASFIVTPAVGAPQSTIRFDASASSATSALQYRWDWENDGIWDTAFGSATTTSHQYLAAGSYTIKLEVKDAAGKTSAATRSVVINAAGVGVPTASFTVDYTGAAPNTVLHFDASGSTDTLDAPANLQVRWDWEDDGVFDTAYSTTRTVTHAFATKGVYTVRLQVKNTSGAIGTVTKRITVDANQPPVAGFTINTAEVMAGDTFIVDAGGCTDDHDAVANLQVRWDWTNDGAWDTAFSTTKLVNYRYPANTPVGTKTIRLQVMDAWGATGTVTKTILVQPSTDSAPTALFMVSPTTGTVTTDFAFDATWSSDLEDNLAVLQVRWDWESDGAWDTGFTTTKTLTHRYATNGQKNITLQVMDSKGLTATYTASVWVN